MQARGVGGCICVAIKCSARESWPRVAQCAFESSFSYRGMALEHVVIWSFASGAVQTASLA